METVITLNEAEIGDAITSYLDTKGVVIDGFDANIALVAARGKGNSSAVIKLTPPKLPTTGRLEPKKEDNVPQTPTKQNTAPSVEEVTEEVEIAPTEVTQEDTTEDKPDAEPSTAETEDLFGAVEEVEEVNPSEQEEAVAETEDATDGLSAEDTENLFG